MSVNKRTTFSGITLAEARRIVEYEFSESVIKLDRNNISSCYEVHITDKIDKKLIEKFKIYWKKNFIVKVYQFKYEL